MSNHRDDQYLLLVLAIMGGVSLVYQVSWVRQLTTLLGSTVVATALITALFMLGMATGAWWAGRYADAHGSAGRLLGWLALGLSMSGALAIPMHRAVVHTYTAVGSGAEPVLVAAGLAAVMTLLPTSCVGAALAVSARAVSFGRRDVSSGVGAAYAVNTAGSVVGALVAGFALVPLIGVTATVAASASVAGAGGVALLALGSATGKVGHGATRTTPQTELDGSQRRWPILLAFTLSGAAIMVYETVWTRELLLVFGASAYAVATMLAAALTGLAIGQYLGGRNKEPRGDAMRTLGVLQLAGAGAAMLSLLLTRLVPIGFYVARGSLPGGFAAYALVQFLLTFAVVAVPCVLLGASAPIAVRLAAVRPTSLGTDIGRAYALNTAGAVVGSLAGGLLLLPLLSTTGSAAVAAALNVVAAALVLRDKTSAAPLAHRWLVTAVALVILGGAGLVSASSASPLLELAARPAIGSASARDLVALSRQMTVVYHRDAAQGRVTVLESPDGALSLRASGVNEGGIESGGQTTETEVVRLPVAILGKLSDVLIVGLGTGVTTTTALEAPGSPHVVTVEINPAVIEASRYFETDPLDNDRSSIVRDDARHYYMTAGRDFDVVASQPSLPLSTYAARMFTRESFAAASGLLRPDGLMVQWLPAYLMDEGDLQMMAKTFGSVFPNTYVWTTRDPSNPSRPANYVMVGVNGSRTIDSQALAAAIAAQAERTLELELLLGPDEIAALEANEAVPMNTDDRPRFEYRVPLQYLRGIWGR